jgi:4-methyl-5(b-hydroxyethyl)-thiazole monophosphate biosynthesis
MAKRAVILLAPGYEELEAVAVVDILRRAGIEALLAGLEEGPVPSARDVKIVPDTTLDRIKDEAFDLIVLPGGLDGTERLAGTPAVVDMLKRQLEQGRYIGAICAAPTVLDRHGLSKGCTITCHPICQEAVKESNLSQERVSQDGLIITSQGPGTALEFALKLVEVLEGRQKMEEVNKGVLARI